MTLALGGIIGFQVYWIRTAMNQSQVQFERNVRETLVQVAERLEQQEAQRLSKQTFVFFSDDANANVLLAPRDSDITVHRISGNQSASLTYSIKADSIFYKKPEAEDTRQRLQKRIKMVDVTVGKMLDKENVSILERVDETKLDSLIHISLLEKGIDLDFQFGVVETGNGKESIVISNVSEPSSEIVTSSFQASLFPGDLTGSSHLLSLYFPEQSAFILRQVGMTLIAGIICIGIILGCFIYTLRIISKQKKLSLIKNDFINNMTHELKTPIATISLATQVLSEQEVLQKPGSVHKYVGVIREENQRLSEQVERVLQSALLENREVEIHCEEIKLNQLIEDILNTFASVNPSVELHTDLAAQDDSVGVDIHHMTNVVNNLLDNAVKYSKSPCFISVSTEEEDDHVKVSVRDKGIGMEASQLRHIFDSFYRVHTGNLHDVKGFGLGLSYVQHIVKLHGGQVDVNSAPGKGSEFIVVIPKFRTS